MTAPGLFAQGVSTIRTRRQNLRYLVALIAALLGVAVSMVLGAALASVTTQGRWALPELHHRPLLIGGDGHGLLDVDGSGDNAHVQFPFTVSWPVPLVVAAIAAVPVFVLWLLGQRWVLARRRYPGVDRHRGLADVNDIRAKYGERAARQAGRYTLPGLSAWQRRLLSTTAFGHHFGAPFRPTAGIRLWFDFETRLRIVARTGWGKSWRLLIPLIRNLPGAAVITSVEPEIFAATVKARTLRRPPVRWGWMRVLRRQWRQPVRYPVYVADLSAPATRMAAGFPQVRWNPIVGCTDFKVATNRARALVSGGDTESDGSDSATDKFFRDSATQVLAAWLHAAALDPTKDIEDLVEWLRDTDLDTATATLRGQEGAGFTAARAAIMNMTVHLDPAAGRTTSGVRRYLNFAISSMGSGQGRLLCGDRHQRQFDMIALIEAGGTVYLLAEVDEMDLARPLLTLFAQEMFLSAERAARTSPGRRLPRTFMGVFDELYSGVRMPILPYVASVQRKYGISFAYAVQSSADEEELFGRAGADRLRGQSHSIIGGYDAASASETTRRAGKTTLVVASRGTGGTHTEQTTAEETLPESDQQELQDGQSVVLGLGLAPFLAYTDRADHRRVSRKRIRREMAQVEQFVERHRTRQLAHLARVDQFDAEGLPLNRAKEAV